MKRTILTTTAIVLLAGCSMFSANPNPPTKIEQSLFDILTNRVTQVVQVTNTVQRFETNYQIITYTITNTANQIVVEHYTNIIPVILFSTNVVTRTNDVEQYTYKPSATIGAVAGISGALANAGAPGIGSLVTMIVLGAAAGWAQLRSTKAGKVNGVLTQTIETAREVIKTTPQGQALEEKFRSWMISHHIDESAISQIASLVDKNVDTADAKSVAAVIANKPATV